MKKEITEQSTETKSGIDKANDVIGLLMGIVSLVTAIAALVAKKDD